MTTNCGASRRRWQCAWGCCPDISSSSEGDDEDDTQDCMDGDDDFDDDSYGYDDGGAGEGEDDDEDKKEEQVEQEEVEVPSPPASPPGFSRGSDEVDGGVSGDNSGGVTGRILREPAARRASDDRAWASCSVMHSGLDREVQDPRHPLPDLHLVSVQSRHGLLLAGDQADQLVVLVGQPRRDRHGQDRVHPASLLLRRALLDGALGDPHPHRGAAHMPRHPVDTVTLLEARAAAEDGERAAHTACVHQPLVEHLPHAVLLLLPPSRSASSAPPLCRGDARRVVHWADLSLKCTGGTRTTAGSDALVSMRLRLASRPSLPPSCTPTVVSCCRRRSARRATASCTPVPGPCVVVGVRRDVPQAALHLGYHVPRDRHRLAGRLCDADRLRRHPAPPAHAGVQGGRRLVAADCLAHRHLPDPVGVAARPHVRHRRARHARDLDGPRDVPLRDAHIQRIADRRYHLRAPAERMQGGQQGMRDPVHLGLLQLVPRARLGNQRADAGLEQRAEDRRGAADRARDQHRHRRRRTAAPNEKKKARESVVGAVKRRQAARASISRGPERGGARAGGVALPAEGEGGAQRQR